MSILLITLSWLVVIIGSGLLAVFSFLDILNGSNNLQNFIDSINFSSFSVLIIIFLVSVVYLLILLLSLIAKLTKYSKYKTVKSKTGEITVSYDSLNKISREYLNNYVFIKRSKVKTKKKGNGVVIDVLAEVFSTEEINQKLDEVKEELSEYVKSTSGIDVKKVNIRVKKIIENASTKSMAKNRFDEQRQVTNTTENYEEIKNDVNSVNDYVEEAEESTL